MSIATEITRLNNAKSAIKSAIENKGVTVPSSTKLDGYASLVNSIPGIVPTGTINITENGENIDVKQYAKANVNVLQPKEYANNNNVYVSYGTYDFSYNSTCYLLKANIRREFDWPQRENDIYTEPFVFTLYGINGEVDINNIELYWGNIVGTAATWGNIFANNKPINYVKNSDGSYTCTVLFDNVKTSNDNFFIAYRLPSSIGDAIMDVTPYIIGYWTD